jgi:hypothetical protein
MGMLTDGHRSFEEMQKYVERIETPVTVRESIKELQDEHLEDLKILYDYHAAEYIQDMKDFYVSRDDTVYLEEGERDQQIIAGYQRLEVRLTFGLWPGLTRFSGPPQPLPTKPGHRFLAYRRIHRVTPHIPRPPSRAPTAITGPREAGSRSEARTGVQVPTICVRAQ